MNLLFLCCLKIIFQRFWEESHNIQQAYRHILSWNIGEYEAKRKIVNLLIAVSNLHLDGKLNEDNILPMFNELLKEILIFESEEQYIEFLKAVSEN